MFQLSHTIFGSGKDLSILQMCSRSLVMFFITLILIRLAGVRAFGQKSALDSIIVIMLGAILSRAVVGASAALPIIGAGFVFALMHRVFAILACRSDLIGKWVKGEKILLFLNGKLIDKSMRKACISDKDIMEELRSKAHMNNLDHVKEVYMERSGELSFVKKE